jgi:hypothetical protein
MPPPEATLRPLPSHRTGVGNRERGPIAAGSALALRFHCQSHNDKSHAAAPPPVAGHSDLPLQEDEGFNEKSVGDEPSSPRETLM